MTAFSSARPISVLLIEDTPTDVRLVRELLSGAPSDHFTIINASTLAEGLERLAADNVDVILLDLGLPDSQGFDTFRAVEEHVPDLPIIVLTVTADEELGLKAIRAGAERFFSKDVLTPDGAYAEMFPHVIHYAIEHKRTEAALRRLADENARRVHKFDALLSSLPDPIYLLDSNERFEYVCPQAERLLGVPREALVGKTWREAGLPSSLMQTLHERFENVLTTGATTAAEIDIETPTGRKKFEYALSPVFGADKSVEGVVLSTHDITERVAAEHALKVSEEQLQALFEYSPIMQIRYDPDGYPTMANRAARDFLGINDVSAIQHVSIFTSPRVTDADKAQLRAGKPARYEQTYDFDALKQREAFPTTQSGVRHVDFSLVPIFDKKGVLAAYLAQVVDITRRKHAEDALQTAHEEVQALNEELQAANEELRVANLELEQRVQERTVELQVTTEELSSTNEELRVANEGLKEEIGHRTRLERAARQDAERTELLNRIITLADEYVDVRAYVGALLDMFVNELDFDTATFRFRHGDISELYDSRGLPEEFIARIQKEHISVRPLNCIYDGEPYVDESYDDSYPARAPEAHVALAIGIPLVAHGAVIGNFGVGGKRTRQLTQQELQTLIAIGHEAGTVIARLRAEEQVRASSIYTRNLIEASLDPLVTIDAEGKITDVNAATEQVTGCSREELIGSDFSDYFTEPEKARAGYKQAFTEGVVRDYPLVIRHKSGKETDVLYNATVFRDEAGITRGVFAAARDVTDRKRAEEELQRYSGHLEALVEERTAQLKASERLAGIGQTAAMIGHDLRNPLQALQFSLELERKYLEAMDSEAQSDPRVAKAAQLFSNMEQQIQYMDKIVSDLQDFARPLTLEREEMSIIALVEETLSVLTIPDSISVRIDVPASITASIDPHLMERMLANLILNAVQAMPHGGELTVGAAQQGSAITITVRDTGEGVPEQMRETLFSPLTTGKAKGTGLGLAVVKRIAEAHNGTIEFETEDGKGTTFIVTVPVDNVADSRST